jgi:hypothetical protein
MCSGIIGTRLLKKAQHYPQQNHRKNNNGCTKVSRKVGDYRQPGKQNNKRVLYVFQQPMQRGYPLLGRQLIRPISPTALLHFGRS